jgi:hypothetical protein
MRRYAAATLLLGLLSGCMNLDTGPDSGGLRPLQAQGMRPLNGGPPTVPGVQGPYGQPVAMAAPYRYSPPPNEYMARAMMSQNVPLGFVQPNGPGGMPGMPATMSPPGVPGIPGAVPGGSLQQTGGQLMTPGPGTGAPGDIMLAQHAMNPATAALPPQQGLRTQVRFLKPTGMQVSWYAQGPDGRPIYSPTPIDTPGKYNFLQNARYRLKLTNIPGRPGLELYPTLEVVPANHKAEAFLAHSSVPLEFTDEDFKQVAEGNYIIKVVYLPDPQFQDVAGTGTDEILSTRLEPGQDPIQEALRRGSILLIIRMGNIDQEAPNTPPLGAPGPAPAVVLPPPLGPHGAIPPGAIPPGAIPPGAVPPGAVPPGGKFGPTQPGILTAPLQVPFWGMGPQGPFAPPGGLPPNPVMPPGGPHGAIPPGAIPPGAIPPGVIPPGGPQGAIPPGVIPPGVIPPGGPQGAIPPGVIPPGALPPGLGQPGTGTVPPTVPAVPNKLNTSAPATVPTPGPDAAPVAPVAPPVKTSASPAGSTENLPGTAVNKSAAEPFTPNPLAPATASRPAAATTAATPASTAVTGPALPGLPPLPGTEAAAPATAPAVVPTVPKQ